MTVLTRSAAVSVAPTGLSVAQMTKGRNVFTLMNHLAANFFEDAKVNHLVEWNLAQSLFRVLD